MNAISPSLRCASPSDTLTYPFRFCRYEVSNPPAPFHLHVAHCETSPLHPFPDRSGPHQRWLPRQRRSLRTDIAYDGVGNLIGRVAEVAGSSTVTETRTVNNLNQITANSVVVTGGGTTNWTFDFDDSGNMTSRSDGTNTTTYAWDEDNRLTLVTLPSSATVAYTYDVLGRMLTRTDSTGTTYFTWDGWTLTSELAPNGTQTRYYAPNGELLYFEVETATTDRPAAYGSAYYGQNYYGALVYSVVSDGIGSIRRIVDAYNNVVSTFDYDAYGRQLPSTSDPLNFPHRYVGAFGVRWDVGTGLYYMRNRWYDPTLQRFISRDALRGDNRYAYCFNNPALFVDIDGRNPTPIFDWQKPQNPPQDVSNTVSINTATFGVQINNLLFRPGSACPAGQKCFLVCTRYIPDPDSDDGFTHIQGDPDKPKSRHSFLVFGSERSDVFGLKSPREAALSNIHTKYATVQNIDYDAFADKSQGVLCKRYCVSSDAYDKVHTYAKDGTPLHKYQRGESTDWVRDALNAGNVFPGGKWPGYGTPVQP